MRTTTNRVLVVLLGMLASAPALAGRLVFDEQLIVCEVQMPVVTIYVKRENLGKAYDLELNESFLPKVVRATDAFPF